MSQVLAIAAFLVSLIGLLIGIGTSPLLASSSEDGNEDNDNSQDQQIPQSQGTEQAMWKTFTTRDNLATVQHPSDWSPSGILQMSGPIDILFISPGSMSDEEEFTGAEIEFIQYEGLSPFSTARDSIETELAQYQNDPTLTQFQIEQPAECSKYMLNGLQACSFAYTVDTDDGPPLAILVVDALADDGTEYEAFYRSEPGLFQQFLTTAEGMIESFRTTESDQTSDFSLQGGGQIDSLEIKINQIASQIAAANPGVNENDIVQLLQMAANTNADAEQSINMIAQEVESDPAGQVAQNIINLLS